MRFLVLFCVSAFAAQPLQLPAVADSTARVWVQWTLEQRYDQVLNAPVAAELQQDPMVPIFQALAVLARYDDLGQQADLNRADVYLQRANALNGKNATSSKAFWVGFLEAQRGYLLTLRGNTVKGALVSRSGAVALGDLENNSDAQGFAATYQYYKQKVFGGLNPWGESPDDARQRLFLSMQQSRYFGALFANALGWVDFDRKRFDLTLRTAQQQLSRSPSNRVFRQMGGDALRRAGQFAQSRQWYEQSLREYRGAAYGSVRHASALGNLVLLCKFQGDAAAQSQYMAEFKKVLPAVEARFPSSLKDELDKQSLWPS